MDVHQMFIIYALDMVFEAVEQPKPFGNTLRFRGFRVSTPGEIGRHRVYDVTVYAPYVVMSPTHEFVVRNVAGGVLKSEEATNL